MNADDMKRTQRLRRGDPRTVGGYTLLGRLGAGGMGVVYLARAADRRLVAVKVVHAELAGDDEFRGRFHSEVERARQVPPFCTAEVLDADADHNPPYLVVEFVDGPSLAETVEERGPLTQANVHAVAVGVASALSAIHGAGVIHRDLKPRNVLLAPGSPKVIDFGIARAFESTSQHTRTGQLVGTVAYMSPERFEAEPGTPLTPAADIFAWGSVVGYAATGRAPFEGESPPVTASRILTGVPNLNGMTDPLLKLVEMALAKDPEDRPTARELLDLLLTAGAWSRPGRTPTVDLELAQVVGDRRQGSRAHRQEPVRVRGHVAALSGATTAPPRPAPQSVPPQRGPQSVPPQRGPRPGGSPSERGHRPDGFPMTPDAFGEVPPRFRGPHPEPRDPFEPRFDPRPEPRLERRTGRVADSRPEPRIERRTDRGDLVRGPAHTRRRRSGRVLAVQIAALLLLIIALVMGGIAALGADRRADLRTGNTLSTTGGPTAAPSTFSVISALNDKCLDVRDGDGGRAVHMLSCSGDPSQVWVWGNDGTLRSLGRCLAVAGAATTDGALVQLAPCDGTRAQQWSVTPGRDVVNLPADKCLDIRDRSTADRARLQLWSCTGSANQKWTLTGAAGS
jgi:serine/threonine protein kinase